MVKLVRNLFFYGIVFSFLGIVMTCEASNRIAPDHKEVRRLIHRVFSPHVVIKRFFDGPYNLLGVVVQQENHQERLLYSDKSGHYLFWGTLVNEKGKARTVSDQQTYLHKLPEKNILQAAKMAHWFEQGDPEAPHRLYVIADPNCRACHYFYQSILPYIHSGQVVVRWILVAFVKPSSLGRAAAIVSADNPAKAFAENERRFNRVSEVGGVSPLTTISDETKHMLTENLAFIHRYGIHSTPILLFRQWDQTVRVLQGATSPERMGRWIKVMRR